MSNYASCFMMCLDSGLLRSGALFAGKGCVYSFDPVGSYEREVYRAGGSAGAILQPLLDNQVTECSFCSMVQLLASFILLYVKLIWLLA